VPALDQPSLDTLAHRLSAIGLRFLDDLRQLGALGADP
jgi:hypothetical protein